MRKDGRPKKAGRPKPGKRRETLVERVARVRAQIEDLADRLTAAEAKLMAAGGVALEKGETRMSRLLELTDAAGARLEAELGAAVSALFEQPAGSSEAPAPRAPAGPGGGSGAAASRAPRRKRTSGAPAGTGPRKRTTRAPSGAGPASRRRPATTDGTSTPTRGATTRGGGTSTRTPRTPRTGGSTPGAKAGDPPRAGRTRGTRWTPPTPPA